MEKPEEKREPRSIRMKQSLYDAICHSAIDAKVSVSEWIEMYLLLAVPPRFRKGMK